MRTGQTARNWFIGLWTVLLLAKLVLAAHLPLFVDEAFYWQEGQHLAWAYSDLPGLTAWLTRLGVAIGGDNTLALRAPFLLVAACLPWLVARITAREFDPGQGWMAGIYAMLLPLLGTLGVLAVPDAAMTLATLLCMDAGTRLLRGVTAGAAVELAVGLAIGGLSHYRFLAVIGVGFLALLLIPQGRRALGDPRVLIAMAFGAAAWKHVVGIGAVGAGCRGAIGQGRARAIAASRSLRWRFHLGLGAAALLTLFLAGAACSREFSLLFP